MRFFSGMFIGAAVVLALLEISLHFMPVNSGIRLARTTAATPIGHYLPQQPFAYSFGWALSNARHGRTNRQGYINSADFAAQNGVLVLGDSFIESMMLDYPDTLQAHLEKSMPGKVHAAATSSNGLADTLQLAAYFSPRMRPRTLVVFVRQDLSAPLAAPQQGHSSFSMAGDGVAMTYSEYAESPFKELVNQSALARYLYYNLKLSERLTEAVSPADATAETATATRRKKQVLEYYFSEFRTLADAHSLRVLFLLDGDREAIYAGNTQTVSAHAAGRTMFMQLAAVRGFDVIDMQPVFKRHWQAYRERMDFLPMDGHWNPVAHRLAANEVIRRLAAASL